MGNRVSFIIDLSLNVPMAALFFRIKRLCQGRNMVYLGPIDPYFLAVILIPEPHFPPNFDP